MTALGPIRQSDLGVARSDACWESEARVAKAMGSSSQLGLFAQMVRSVREQTMKLFTYVVVDVLARFMKKGGAASDMLGNVQCPVIHTEETVLNATG